MAEVQQSDVIAGVVLVDPDVFGDDRGVFVQTYRREWFSDRREMVQSNRSDRRLHDLRVGSPTDGATLELDLGDQLDGTYSHRGVYIPPGVAHGFAALTDVMMTYMVDEYYNPADELGVAWNDPAIDADWGITDPQLSARDQNSPARADLVAEQRPVFPQAVER